MAHIVLTKDNFEQEVLQSQQTVLVDFWAEWCGPCRMLSPIIDEVAEEHTDVKVGKIDVDAEAELARQYRVMSVPTLLVFHRGELIHRDAGGKSKEEILEMLGK